MSFTLIPPGTRKGNKTWAVRGSINGREYEFVSRKADEKAARRVAVEYEAKVTASPSGATLKFAAVVERYKSAKTIKRYDLDRLDTWVDEIGNRMAAELIGADFHDVANRVKAGMSGATRNRFMRPAIAAWHYCADLGLFEHKRVIAFEEEEPKTRALSLDAAAALIGAAETAEQRRLLVWLVLQGTRITDTLKRVVWVKDGDPDRLGVDLERGIVRLVVAKTRKRKPDPTTFALHPLVIEELSKVNDRTGPVFAWSDRSSLRRWLPRLCEAVGIEFTPHMGRHTLGAILNENGVDIRTIQQALGHAKLSSTQRYVKGNVEVVRAAIGRIELPNTLPRAQKPEKVA